MAPDKQSPWRLKYLRDGAYAGTEKIVARQNSRVSRKRKPGKKLTPAEKEYNRALANIRIRAEHAKLMARAFRMMGEGCRNPRKKYTSINDTVCGLANMMRLWELAGA